MSELHDMEWHELLSLADNQKDEIERLSTECAEAKELVDKLIRNARLGADMTDYIVRAVDVHELQVRVSGTRDPARYDSGPDSPGSGEISASGNTDSGKQS